MSSVLVSIIIPAYNSEKYIGGAIQSCINQNLKELEIIIINDGSTDNTQKVVEKFLSDSRVRLINQENKGVSAARNLGIETSSGKYLTFLDSDDELETGTISKNLKVLEARQDIDWLCFSVKRKDMNGNFVNEISSDMLPSFKYDELETITTSETFERMTKRLLPTCVCGALYRRTYFDKEFKGGRFEDTIMVMELLRKQGRIMLSPYGAYIYYDRSNSFINSVWGVDKWISYVNVLLETMQTKTYFSPEKYIEIEKEKTRLYYTLRYLRAKNYRNKDFKLPLKHFLSKVGHVRPSYSGWCKFVLKSVLYRCKNTLLN